ncbi:MAG: toxin-antitoxin system, antitoxin component, Xre family protein [Oscillospiraceae bacterium]|nr:toxin-antitoxin system, antitoxin component, Xre family protein [Oscillospiraceae bacterium]
MTNTRLLEQKIKDSGLKLTYIADRLGVVWITLRRKLDGESEFKQSEIVVLKDLLHLTDEDVNAIFFISKVEKLSTK